MKWGEVGVLWDSTLSSEDWLSSRKNRATGMRRWIYPTYRMSPLAVVWELISSWSFKGFGPEEWWRSNSLTPRTESFTTLLKTNVNIDSPNIIAMLIITSLQIRTWLVMLWLRWNRLRRVAVYRQWRDEIHEQRLDLPVALHASPSQALPLAARPDLASLGLRPTTHHSRRCSSPPRRGDSMRHGAASLVLLGRHSS